MMRSKRRSRQREGSSLPSFNSLESRLLLSNAPTIESLMGDINPITRGADLTLTAVNVADTDGTIANVKFYLDDGDGVFEAGGVDTLLGTDALAAGGWTWTGSTASFALGNNTFFAQATDNASDVSEAAMTLVTVQNDLPTIGSLAGAPNPVARGVDLVLTAADVTDVDGTIASVSFYLDANANGTLEVGVDTPLGTDALVAGGWTWTGSTADFEAGVNTFFAVATDNDGDSSAAAEVGVEIENVLPTLGALEPNDDNMDIGADLTLTATGAADEDREVASVSFYLDDGNGLFDADTDTLLGTDEDGEDGWSWTGTTEGLEAGENTFFAQAADTDGGLSNAVQAQVLFNPAPLTWRRGDITVSVYDLAGEADILAENIRVTWGHGGAITSITLRGDQAMGGLGLVVHGATSVGRIVDHRTGEKGDIAFIASDARIGTLDINGDIAGFNLNGRTFDGVAFPDDVDGDGDTDDATALYVSAGHCGWLNVDGEATGDVLLAGGVGVLRLDGATNVDIILGDSGGRVSAVNLGDLTDVTIDVANPLRKAIFGDVQDTALSTVARIALLTARQWVGGEITADSIGSFKVTGSGLPGDLTADVIVVDGLGTLDVKGTIGDSVIRVGGNVGKVKAGAMIDSELLIGLADDVGALPEDDDDFGDLLPSLGSLDIKGLAGADADETFFSNSNVAAWNLGKVTLRNVLTDTPDSDEPFGLAGHRITSYKRYANGVRVVSTRREMPDDGADDFVIRVV